MGSWVKKQVLGKGTFGTVSLAVNCFPKDSLHIPAMAVKSADFKNSSSLQKEAKILYELRDCPGIVRCFGEDVTVEDGKRVYNMLLEFAPGGSLGDLIRQSGGHLPESDVAEYTRTILEALSYMHGKGYVHCDIKPGNILVFPSKDGGNNVKIADFGLSAKWSDCKVEGSPGTLLYRSPESILFGSTKASVDIWSLGCTVVEMVTGKSVWPTAIFELKGVNELLREIALGKRPPKIPQNMSDEGKDFLGKCLVKDPKLRWTADMLLNHPFLQQVKESARLQDQQMNNNNKAMPCFARSSNCDDKWIHEQLEAAGWRRLYQNQKRPSWVGRKLSHAQAADRKKETFSHARVIKFIRPKPKTKAWNDSHIKMK
ncbi:mitogen-activated protein kinase kinase kinase 20-like [Diospyros lotus]|uniref:mitogen-activated protein kinase kinase kinase 20-like n=1 Tax=Diospyros lotus TaxID=55363 RepID=UPI00224F5398|nr:mitogen-activated protein kinase kinase kinase 20-like [Diospyros lotus]